MSAPDSRPAGTEPAAAQPAAASSPLDPVRWFLITSGGLGLSPVASGTVGTLGGVALGVLLQFALPEHAVLAWIEGGE